MNKKDKKEIAEMIAQTMSAMNSVKADEKSEVKISSKPKNIIPSKDRGKVLDGLTNNQRIDLYGEIDNDNIFKGRYKCAHKLYKDFNIDGRPNVRYDETFKHFIIPICKANKKTTKQMENIKKLALKQMKQKADGQTNEKAVEWLNKGMDIIKGIKI